MRFPFFKRKIDSSQAEILSWNLMVAAIDPDQCWRMTGQFRGDELPSSVKTCEASFLMGSVVRQIIRESVPENIQQPCITSAEAAYFKTFDDQSEDPLPDEMKKIYGEMTLGHVSRIALAAYGEEHDELFLTSARLTRRVRTDPRDKAEIYQVFLERANILKKYFQQGLRGT